MLKLILIILFQDYKKINIIFNETIDYISEYKNLDEFGNNTLFVWEFKIDIHKTRIINVKYVALDEIIGFIGGNLSIILLAAGYFI